MIGLDVAGISESIEIVLKRFDLSTQLNLAQNIFVTGGVSKFPFLKNRIENDVRMMLPSNSKINIVIASDPSIDGWSGASALSDYFVKNFDDFFITKQMYSEMGKDYLRDHIFSNPFVPTPE
eukprot:c15093_g1_i2.p1 GENE.c15093_g1_i2~~c15093_g1_i2.p1  ORF type:complete len:122 (+),score=51.32 c15093_g1_i2:235-600(+)